MTESEFKALERKYELHIPYHNGYENGYADAEAKWLSMIEKIHDAVDNAESDGFLINKNGHMLVLTLTKEHIHEIIDKVVKECTPK